MSFSAKKCVFVSETRHGSHEMGLYRMIYSNAQEKKERKKKKTHTHRREWRERKETDKKPLKRFTF